MARFWGASRIAKRIWNANRWLKQIAEWQAELEKLLKEAEALMALAKSPIKPEPPA